jgi:hypothetical protein
MRFDEILDQAIEPFTSMGVMSHPSLSVAYLSETYLLAGRIQEATEQAHHARDLAREYKEHGNEACVLRLLGDIAMHNDAPEIDQAETRYHQALILANELGMRPLQAHCHRGLGTVYSQTG